MRHLITPGGKRLRGLREFHGKTQLDVELDASLGIGYLQRLELGRVQQPERDTLERILAALDARYTERREVLELFGYVVDAPIPNDTEISWAISVCQAELDSAVFPTYLLDCAHRLLHWNPLTPRLYVVPHTNLRAEGLRRLSMLRLIFDPAFHVMPRIKNADAFFPAQIRALRYEMQRFHDEPWYGDLIAEMQQCATFARHWDQEKREAVHIPARPLTPMEIDVNSQALNFRIISEPFVQDHRFRVIFCPPADANTTQQCIDWLHEGVNA
ncbi:MAG: helix-turn-helix domain-containing protein [Anaerolineae bacterium]|nr:helix-turn-helix domain-containing protein [Anaerolineae bacterium]